MSVLSELPVQQGNASLGAAIIPIDEIIEAAKPYLARAFWEWFHAHEDTRIVKVGFWFIHKTVKVRDLRWVFEHLFGPEATS